MSILMTVLKMAKRQPNPPCKYCVRDCKDDEVTHCQDFASKAKLKARRW